MSDLNVAGTGVSGFLGEAPTDGQTYGRQSLQWVSIPDEAPIDGISYVRQDGTWIQSAIASGGVEEAPNDGTIYARQSLGWVPALVDAPLDGFTYARQSDSWVKVVEEAPSDSVPYARQDGAWVSAATPAHMSCRGSWKTLDGLPIAQLLLANGVPQIVQFNSYTEPHPAVTITTGNSGEVDFHETLTNVTFSWSAQVYRDGGGGGDVEFAIALEVYDGTNWGAVADSGVVSTFRQEERDETQHLSYTLSVPIIPANTRLRFVQCCTNVTADIGIYSSKPIPAMPVAPGFVLSIIADI